MRQALLDVAPGFWALTDFRWLESMRVTSIIRIIPDPGKDIGLNILSQFHYSHELPISTVETLVEALDRLLEHNAADDSTELEAQIRT